MIVVVKEVKKKNKNIITYDKNSKKKLFLTTKIM